MYTNFLIFYYMVYSTNERSLRSDPSIGHRFFAYTNTLRPNVIPGITDFTLETIIRLAYYLITDETAITYMTFLTCSLS